MNTFRMKAFGIKQDDQCMKVNTDGVLLGAWTDLSCAQSILDVGTGTGVIAIMMAQRSEQAHVDAIEIDYHAYTIAAANAADCPWSERIDVHALSLQDYASTCQKRYDLIISNPPYFDAGTRSRHRPHATARHTDSLSHEELITLSASLLSESGRIALILPPAPAHGITHMAHELGLSSHRTMHVYPDQDKKLERLMIELGKKQKHTTYETLHIRDVSTGDYSQAYRDLTKDFYLKF